MIKILTYIIGALIIIISKTFWWEVAGIMLMTIPLIIVSTKKKGLRRI